jgi:hypothetical protein
VLKINHQPQVTWFSSTLLVKNTHTLEFMLGKADLFMRPAQVALCD